VQLAEAEIQKLRAEVATLVSTIDDIKARLSRRPEPLPPPAPSPRVKVSPPRRSIALAIVAALAGLALGVIAWRTLTSFVPSEPPAVTADPAPSQPPPQVMAEPPVNRPVPVTAAVAVPPPPPVTEPPARAVERRLYVGSLSIDAQPAGEVFLNRKSAGRTPLRVDNLRAGSHLVWIQRDGYRRWTRVVQVPADRISRVFAELEAVGPR
jgi:hypothetical protein